MISTPTRMLSNISLVASIALANIKKPGIAGKALGTIAGLSWFLAGYSGAMIGFAGTTYILKYLKRRKNDFRQKKIKDYLDEKLTLLSQRTSSYIENQNQEVFKYKRGANMEKILSMGSSTRKYDVDKETHIDLLEMMDTKYQEELFLMLDEATKILEDEFKSVTSEIYETSKALGQERLRRAEASFIKAFRYYKWLRWTSHTKFARFNKSIRSAFTGKYQNPVHNAINAFNNLSHWKDYPDLQVGNRKVTFGRALEMAYKDNKGAIYEEIVDQFAFAPDISVDFEPDVPEDHAINHLKIPMLTLVLGSYITCILNSNVNKVSQQLRDQELEKRKENLKAIRKGRDSNPTTSGGKRVDTSGHNIRVDSGGEIKVISPSGKTMKTYKK